jgi:hypothetical protein
VSSARTDLCGGRSAMIVPTATSDDLADRYVYYDVADNRTLLQVGTEQRAKLELLGSIPNTACRRCLPCPVDSCSG